MKEVKYYGIRHHGPGSAKMLRTALEDFSPEIILIELPADVQHLLDIFHPGSLLPPVSLLQYDPGAFEKAYFLPMAEFSPEWIALNFAYNRGVPVKAIDLPGGATMALSADAFRRKSLPGHAADPLAYFAEQMGYRDVEAWWEFFFELDERPYGHFETIELLMEEIRAGFPDSGTYETLLREAHMRRSIFSAGREFGKIAVVTGAWHIPAVKIRGDYKDREDAAILKKLKKTGIESCWIPWSYERLRKEGGYGAGVENPAWYEWIFKERVSASSKWIVKIAGFLRGKHIPVSVSSAIDAQRLAAALAAMRGISLPGLPELLEAVKATFGADQIHMESLLKADFLTGYDIGFVDENLNTVPIQKDFSARVRAARFTKELRAGAGGLKVLDLRKPANLAASNLLHTLTLSGIPWGEWADRESAGWGNFKETWELKWLPEYNLALLKAGLYGNTLDEAAVNMVREQIENNNFGLLGSQIDHVLKCGIPGIFSMVVELISEKIASDTDIDQWYTIFPKLVHFYRNGNVRRIDREQLGKMLEKLYIKVCLYLDLYLGATDESGEKMKMHTLIQCDRGVKLWLDAEEAPSWTAALLRNMHRPGCPALVRGACARLVFQRGQLPVRDLLVLANREITDRTEQEDAVKWLAGFLAENPSGIIIQPELLGIIDEWVGSLAEDVFRQVLPALRKIFAPMQPADKIRLLTSSVSERKASEDRSYFLHTELRALVEENLARILGER